MYATLPDEQRRVLWSYLGRTPGDEADVAWQLLGLASSSAASLAIAPLQDVLNLGSEARMNRPGSTEGNWRWRVVDAMLTDPAFDRLRALTAGSGRLSTSPKTPEGRASDVMNVQAPS